MDHQLQEINQRAERFASDDVLSNSSNKESRISGERKCPSHVIDVTCDESMVENQGVCRICHLNAKESGELIELGCGCKGELGVAHLRCAEAWFRVRGYRWPNLVTYVLIDLTVLFCSIFWSMVVCQILFNLINLEVVHSCDWAQEYKILAILKHLCWIVWIWNLFHELIKISSLQILTSFLLPFLL